MSSPELSPQPVESFEINPNAWRWRVMELLGSDHAATSVVRFFDHLGHTNNYFTNQAIDQSDKIRIADYKFSIDREDGPGFIQRYGFTTGRDYFSSALTAAYNRFGDVIGSVLITDYPLFIQKVSDIKSMNFLEYGYTNFGAEDGHKGDDVKKFKSGLITAIEAAQTGELYQIAHPNPSAHALQLRDAPKMKDELSQPFEFSTFNALIGIEAHCRTMDEKRKAAAHYVAKVREKSLKEIARTDRFLQILQVTDFDLSS